MSTKGSVATLPLILAGFAQAQPPESPALPAGTGQTPAYGAWRAQPPADEPGDTGKPASGADMHLSFSPYLWVTNFSGDISVKNIQINVNRSFIDILDNSDTVFGLMGALDLDYKGLVFQLNGSWVTAEESKQKGVFQTGTVDASVDLDAAWMEFFGGYRFLDRPLSDAPDARGRFKLDGFVGGRVTAVDVNTTLSASTSVTLPGGDVLSPGRSVERGQSSEWVEPLVGFRAIFNLDERWFIQLRGDVGGFGVSDSEFSWQAAAVAGYRWNLDGWSIGLMAGYRALGQDHASGDLNWDVVTHGPLVGLTLSLSF